MINTTTQILEIIAQETRIELEAKELSKSCDLLNLSVSCNGYPEECKICEVPKYFSEIDKNNL